MIVIIGQSLALKFYRVRPNQDFSYLILATQGNIIQLSSYTCKRLFNNIVNDEEKGVGFTLHFYKTNQFS